MVKTAGCGATGNATSGHVALAEREADGDWLDAQGLFDGAPSPLRTSVTVLKPRTILTRNVSPDVPFSQSINAYVGCEQPQTVACQSGPASTLSNADELFDQNRAGAIAKVSLRSLLGTYAAIEPDTKFTPHRLSLFPVGYSPSLGIELLAASPETVDRSSILNGNEPAIFGAAAIESTILEVPKPIANHQLARTVSHVLISNAGSGLRSGGCNYECDDQRHVYSLSEPSSSAMVSAW